MGAHGGPLGAPGGSPIFPLFPGGYTLEGILQCKLVHKIAEQDSETLETLKWTGFLSKMQR